jgi:hypothetical protein
MPKVIFDRVDKKRQRVPEDVLEALEALEARTASAARVAARHVQGSEPRAARNEALAGD